MTNPPRTGVPCLRNPEHWMVLPWSPTANVHDVVRHFMRFELYRDATDLEHLAYYESYVAALESAYERGPEAYWSSQAERWYHELHGAVLCCVEQYRSRCKENENNAQIRRTDRVVRLRDGEVPGAAGSRRPRTTW